MKLAWKQIEPFVKSPDPAARAILVYGPDDGLMRERAKTMGLTAVSDLNDPFNSVLLTADQILEDPARLPDEANAISMMGGKRLLRIDDARDAIAPLIKDYLKSPNENALLILMAGELGPKSPLRALFEKAENAAALPCYVEDERDMAGFVRRTLQESGFGISPDAASWLAAAVTGDRGRARSELEKIITYMGANKQITLDDARDCCGDAGERTLDDLAYGTGGGNAAVALRAFETLTAEGTPAVAILRALQNHFRRLHLARARYDAGDAPDAILKTLSPPVFFKQADSFRAQMQRWQLPALEKIMARLSSLEADCKKTAAPAETLCAQAILSIGSMK